MNFRTSDDARETIFRGHRVLAGIVFSKWLGSMARALEAKSSVQGFLDYFILHVGALAEFQTGLQHAGEEEYSGVEFGVRTSLEIRIDPDSLFISFTYDSLPDWLGQENYFLGIRYFPQCDFALDVLGGRLGQDYGVNIGLAWIF